jgi:hypothetical protein
LVANPFIARALLTNVLEGPCQGSADIPLDESDAPSMANFERLSAISDELGALGHGDIAEDYLPQDVLAMLDEDRTRSTAGMQDAFDDCASAGETAQVHGDNAGCDALYDACDQRNPAACNDLYWVSAVGSEYESFGATCGGRTEFGEDGFGGLCEDLR